MKELRYTLLADGTSDKILMPILTWLLREHGVTWAIQAQWVDVGRLFLAKSPTLTDKIHATLKFYPCDLLFIHRDAEKEPLQKRVQEIQDAIKTVKNSPLHVCVIPVRMQEAWLLFDEAAIRSAAGNPSGRELIKLPLLKTIEHEPDPKETLHNLLRKASGLTGRRLKDFQPRKAVKTVTDLINDFSPLRVLSAFQRLEQDIALAVSKLEIGSK